MPDGDQPHSAPTWLSPATLAAARAAMAQSNPAGRSDAGDSWAVREVILAHHPALPLTMIAEAVAYVLRSA